VSLATLIMAGLGLLFFAIGAALFARSFGVADVKAYPRRIAGTMLAALGLCLVLFAYLLVEPTHA